MKRLAAMLTAAGMLLLTGCSPGNISPEGLLSAPKLSEEQSKIHEALLDRTGRSITLKYPQNGDNRSAYVIANLDDEPGDEAIVFFEYTNIGSGDEGIRMNILDKTGKDGAWESVYEAAGAGTDIDRVIISRLGGNAYPSVIVGYKTMNIEEKTLEVYNYADKQLTRIGEENYSVLDTMDINNDRYNEIIVIQQDQAESVSQAFMLQLEDGAIVKKNPVQMAAGSSAYTNAVKGRVTATQRGLFIDSLTADGQLRTEILYYKYSSLQNPMAQLPDILLPQTYRESGYYSADIDGDGAVEIPVTSIMRGYEDYEKDDRLYETSWYAYEDFYRLEKKYTGYYSLSDGWAMMFPSRWKSLVTVTRDSKTGEIVFWKYEGKISDNMTELMRVTVCAKSECADYLYDGYQEITTKGQLVYLVKSASAQLDSLVLTLDEVKNNFYVL
ncbi:MAG: hypothetical protein QM689_05650 [Oscillospiraceae bacterium]